MPNLKWLGWLTACLIALVGISALCFEEAGIVGEVALGWQSFPQVLSSTQPFADSYLSDWGPFQRYQTRPILRLGDWPWAINIYTSGIFDWPSRMLVRLGASEQFIRSWHCALGILPIAVLTLGLRLVLRPTQLCVLGILMVTDWHYLAYKNLLGGTEIALQTAWACVIVGLIRLSHRQSASVWLAVGVGIGLLAKWTFLLSLLVILPALWLWKRQLQWKKMALIIGFFCWPQLITQLAFWGAELSIRSHDFSTLQLSRVWGAMTGSSPARESLNNIWPWLLDPLQFFSAHYKSPQQSTWWGLHALALALTVLALRGSSVLSRQLTTLLTLQVIVILFVARDLHHLAVATPLLMLCFASLRRPWVIVVALCWCLGNIDALRKTDLSWQKSTVPTFNRSNQENIKAVLRKHSVSKLITMDYEVMGLLEQDFKVKHGWGAISHERRAALPFLIKEAAGGHLLVLKSSAALIYNLQPSENELMLQAKLVGAELTELERWDDDRSRLYAVSVQ